MFLGTPAAKASHHNPPTLRGRALSLKALKACQGNPGMVVYVHKTQHLQGRVRKIKSSRQDLLPSEFRLHDALSNNQNQTSCCTGTEGRCQNSRGFQSLRRCLKLLKPRGADAKAPIWLQFLGLPKRANTLPRKVGVCLMNNRRYMPLNFLPISFPCAYTHACALRHMYMRCSRHVL